MHTKERERFSLLHDHTAGSSASKSTEGLEACSSIVLSMLQIAFPDRKWTLEMCSSVICKLICNLFTIIDDFLNEAGIGCYPNAALLNHSCAPNCIQRFDASAHIVIRTNTDVAKGEELNISYIDTAMPTWYRQRELLWGYHFHCQCLRCTRVDGQDGYVCLAKSSVTCATGNGDGRDTSTSTNCHGVCHPTYQSSYHHWVSGHCPDSTCRGGSVPAASVTQQGPMRSSSESDVFCPYPYEWLLASKSSDDLEASARREMMGYRANDGLFLCETCGSGRNAKEMSTDIAAIRRIMSDAPPGKSCVNQRSLLIERFKHLHAAIGRFYAILPQLLRLVPTHHYCVLQCRKQLKCVFEQTLPVRDGTLLFPDLCLEGVSSMDKGYQGKSAGKSNAGGITGAELQLLYHDNLRQILAICSYCYGIIAPTLCYTYYRIQYVWFVLSKHQSVQAGCTRNSGLNCRRAEDGRAQWDLAAYQEVRALLPQLLRDVKVVYGGDHAFVASVEQCVAEVDRVLR